MSGANCLGFVYCRVVRCVVLQVLRARSSCCKRACRGAGCAASLPWESCSATLPLWRARNLLHPQREAYMMTTRERMVYNDLWLQQNLDCASGEGNAKLECAPRSRRI